MDEERGFVLSVDLAFKLVSEVAESLGISVEKVSDMCGEPNDTRNGQLCVRTVINVVDASDAQDIQIIMAEKFALLNKNANLLVLVDMFKEAVRKKLQLVEDRLAGIKKIVDRE